MKRLLLALAFLAAVPAAVRAQPVDPCTPAIAAAERAAGLPPGLLLAIGVTESGRPGPGGRVVPSPWAVNASGVGRYHATAEEAIAAVQALQASGVQSIDVGCMQVNLMHHPAAFANLQQAFDPAANAAYAARFLVSLRAGLGDWMSAAAAYHSLTPERGGPYAQRVAANWSGAPPGAFVPALAGGPAIDPYGVYTPEFRRRMENQAAARLAPSSAPALAPPPRHFPSQLAQRAPAAVPGTRLAALENRLAGRPQ